MSGEATSVGAGYALDAITGRATVTARTVYLALVTTLPTDATTLASMGEITTAGYARVAVTWTVPVGDPRTTSNTALITFGPFTADPPNVPYCALVSAASGTTGDFLYFWILDTARDAANGDSIQFAIGALVMNLD
jgi:hypothetical protein